MTQGLRHRLDCFGGTKASRSQRTALMCRQSLRLRGLEGVRRFGGLHRSHQDQYKNERGREPDAGGLAEQDSPGEEMGCGADDFVVDQAPECAYSVGEEG
jgi:hypothetical protein